MSCFGTFKNVRLSCKEFLLVGILAVPVVNSFISVCCFWCDGVIFKTLVGFKELYSNFVVVMVLSLVIKYLDLALISKGGFFNQMQIFLVAYPFPLSFFKTKYKLGHKCFQKIKKTVWQAVVVRVIGSIIQITLKTYGVKHFWKIWSYEVDIINLLFCIMYLVSSLVSGSSVKLLCKAMPSALGLDDFWRNLSFTIVLLDLLLIQEFVLDDICGKSHIFISTIVIIEMLCLVSINIVLFPANSSQPTAKKVSSSSPLSLLK